MFVFQIWPVAVGSVVKNDCYGIKRKSQFDIFETYESYKDASVMYCKTTQS